MDKEIGSILHALSNAFVNESDSKHADWIRRIKEDYSHLDLKKPETFSLLLSTTIKDQARALMRHVLPTLAPSDMDSKLKHNIEFAFLQYEFITRHLKSVILKVEGYGCSTDKTRWLIDSYVKHLLTGELPSIEEREYWHPACGEITDWLDWIDSMNDLYCGDFERYALAKTKIISSYVKVAREKE
ncbi:hypothetical protein [Paenibacillus polymyxa]|uniref:Uncharacterized protein n=1 Tax=Paenibacillus polymyxa (strain SC2) TaxID=886882 RepID=E3EL76_PAEPS|nr:hypothetical protein [Paenibacillus polymyxa]ADO59908.1 hypothetical protein PPSC2_28625 [Paenibacillus polymyxa SC2]WPQ59868.1 hypothetical protein SKN87_26640 [Paenibacillus polymyxa]